MKRKFQAPVCIRNEMVNNFHETYHEFDNLVSQVNYKENYIMPCLHEIMEELSYCKNRLCCNNGHVWMYGLELV
jgi:hypothetical protein